MAKTADANDKLMVTTVEIRTATIRIVGDSPLIMHKWSEKAKKMILDKQTKETKTKGREAKIPFQDFIDSAYWLTEKPHGNSDEECEKAFINAVENGARWGFPVTAIKQATASASTYNELGIAKTKIRAAFFIEGEGPELLAEVKGCVPEMREDMVRVGGMSKTADIRHRAQFNNWYMDLNIKYNNNGAITLEQIINLINIGGLTCGIGEWRPEKDGSFGMYHVENVK